MKRAMRFVLLLVAAICSTHIQADLAASKPNIIFILTDDLGYGDLGRNGNPILKTPNLDRFYDQSIHFEDFHVSPTCSPTRSALMSGKHEFKNGVTHTLMERERMSLKTTTVAQVLKSAGYTTGIFGKWHLGDEDSYQPDRRGFDEVFIHGAGGIGQAFVGSCGDAPGNTYFDPVIKHNGVFVKTHGFCTDVFFAQAEEWIAATKGKQPFFCYLAPNAAHVPLSCPPEYEKLYSGKVPPDAAKFFGMIANIDDNVGKLMAKLKEWGIDNQTLVIYMNDNGGYPPATKIWNANMRGAKATAYNGGTRAMSLWRWPQHIKPGACERLTAHIDIMPTFAELAGVAAPKDIDGFSVVPLLENPSAPWHDDRILFTHVGRWGGMKPSTVAPEKFGGGPGQCSMRWQQYIQVYEKGGWRLYDLQADPGEKTDIAAQHPDVVAKLSAAYDAWWEQILPCLENESAWKTAPKVNPFKAQYWKQFNGPGPNNVPPPTGE
jgi:arylsulfatase A-like enzyme